MSYDDGWAALNLEMPARVPRTEYSAEMHWPLIRAVTGRETDASSSPEEQQAARVAFMRAWHYDFCWNTCVYRDAFDGFFTRMGHAEYQAGGADFSEERGSPFSTPEQVLAFDPWEQYGKRDHATLVRMFQDNYQAACANYPDAVNMSGIYITCISGLLEIFGWDNLLMALGADPAGFGALTNRYASWIQQYFDALADARLPVVMVHDDITWTSGPFYHPDWYREYVFPNYHKFFDPLRDGGSRILFTSDGNYTEFVDDIVAAGAHGLVLEPATDMAYIAGKYGKTHVFIGNGDTRILLQGSRAAIRAEVARCMAIGKECPGFFMAVGNHIPANTPVENALYYNEVYEEFSRR